MCAPGSGPFISGRLGRRLGSRPASGLKEALQRAGQ